MGMSESESFRPRFGNIKRKGKKQSSKPSPFSNQAAEISPSRLDSGKAAVISVKSLESEVCSEELAPKQISEEEYFSARKLDRRSWVRIAKAFRFTTALDLHPNSRNGANVSQDSNYRGGDADDTPVIEQPKAQEIRPNNEEAESIPGPIEQTSKASRIYAAVDSKSRKLLKSIDFHRKLSSRVSAPNSYFKRREFKSADRLSSSSSYPHFPAPDMPAAGINRTPNSQDKMLNLSEKRKGTIIEDGSGEGEGYNMAISLGVLIIIMGCLVMLSGRFVAVVCTSFWWYLLPRLLKKYRALTAVAAEIPNN